MNQWGPVHTSSEKFENAALLPPSTLIRHENGAFRKRSSTEPKEFENAGFLIWRGRKNFENGAFRKRSIHENHLISLTEFPSITNPKSKMIGDCCVIKFLPRSVDGKHLMPFHSEAFVSTSQAKYG